MQSGDPVTLATDRIEVSVNCEIDQTFRVESVASMFDVSVSERSTETFKVQVAKPTEDWQIGAIVGPSGSGKSTVAREAYGKQLWEGARWPRGKSLLDGFDKSNDVKEITQMLTAVGFSTVPAWVRPYQVLSNGQKFRCDLARALLSNHELIAFDEFTSVVDRTVAKIGSAAVAKSIRKGIVAKKFVAVTCHYDILEWLTPDWVLDMASGKLARGCLRRPGIELSIRRVKPKSAWPLFKRHHYLSGSLGPCIAAYVAFVDDQPVAFCAGGPMLGRKNFVRLTRTVVLPDFQGVGIGSTLSDWTAARFAASGKRVAATTGNPAMIAKRQRSPRWRVHSVSRHGKPPTATFRTGKNNSDRYVGALNRATVAFEYVPQSDARY